MQGGRLSSLLQLQNLTSFFFFFFGCLDLDKTQLISKRNYFKEPYVAVAKRLQWRKNFLSANSFQSAVLKVKKLKECSTLCNPMQPTRLLCPRDSPGKNTGVGSHFLLQGIFLTQGLNLGLLHCRQVLHRLNQGTIDCNSQERAWRENFCLKNLSNLRYYFGPGKIQSSQQLGRVGSKSWSYTKEPVAQILPRSAQRSPFQALACQVWQQVAGALKSQEEFSIPRGHVTEKVSNRLRPGAQWGEHFFSGGI